MAGYGNSRKGQQMHSDDSEVNDLEMILEEWKESQNGNFYRPLDGDVIVTVCLCKDGRWRGISDDKITGESFDAAEKAMSAIDDDEVTFIPFRPRDTGWKAAKRGGFYRQVHGTIYTIKQATSGSWFVMVGDVFVKDQWFSSVDAAKEYVLDLMTYEL
jgi:hypothetical protein